MVKLSYAVLLTTFFLSSCFPVLFQEDDLIELARSENLSKSLRLNGYYFSEFGDDDPSYDIYFFYKNGIILYGTSPSVSNIKKMEEKYRSGEYYNFAKKIKFSWGVYQIKGKEIQFERWYPSAKPYESFLRSGKILNETTFRITNSYNSDGSEKKEEDNIYHFKPLSPKPDSTNTFIK